MPLRFVLLLLLLPLAAACGQREDNPQAVVQALFADHFMTDMAFTPASAARKRNWLTPDLNKEIDAYFAKPTKPDEVPPIDGDPFTNSQDYPSGFAVGAAMSEGEKASVPVVLTTGAEKQTVTVQLVRQSGAWLIDDLAYEDGTTFRGLLKQPS